MLFNQNWQMPTTPAQLLRRAADVMDTRGLAKMVFVMTEDKQKEFPRSTGDMGSVCIQGALMAAMGTPDDQLDWLAMNVPLINETMDKLRIAVPSGPVLWNNNKATTKDEVVTRLRQVADELEPV